MENAPPLLTVHVCRAKSCTRRGAADLAAELEATFKQQGVQAQVLRHDCFDLCKRACNALLEVPGAEPRLYTQLHPRQAERFARSLIAELRADELTAVGD